ncbi:Serine/threonine-protein kinase [Wickerhamomyces ciferrii]|uniref:Serine/threonine-protein kinase n=1 Tax=Wickerhamomyces ciferrii (strain ATCC 14091 / BCRC 22168 / CBS 111 / JCM 3599 / NBRC 0793 / NRRL Y-1031 F-60-10) TaxID=1206466 RepID=K0KMM7_WICCF|nr:Serine/threonine-protein kinase [Wickerhamomyces ciferrii]CCH44211.1 Serine/threonine-protein kinase [Wickerhamomyces ciferrii]
MGDIIQCKTSDYIFYTQKNNIQLINPSISIQAQLCYTGHNSIINSIDLNDQHMSSVSNIITIHDILETKPIRRIYPQENKFQINQVKYLNQDLISTIDDNQCLKIYDLRQDQFYKPIQEYSHPKDSINCMDHKLEDFKIICGSNDGSLYSYDLRQGLVIIDPLETPITALKIQNDKLLVNRLNNNALLINLSSNEQLDLHKTWDKEYKCCVEIFNNTLFVGTEQGQLNQYNLEGTLINTITTNGIPSTITTDHDSNSLIIGSNYIRQIPNRKYQHKSSSPEPKKPSLPQYKELLPRFIIKELIGEGAFSKVYKALDSDLNIEVAIKVIDKNSMNKSQLDSILKEISIMRRLNHPNIIKFINYIQTSSKTFLILELLNGGEIFNKIVELTYFSEDLSKHVLIQIVNSVKYLHDEVGVVHRDIKPENLLFESIQYIPSTDPISKLRKSDDETKKDEGEFTNGIGGGTIGTVKLADFGLSKVLFDQATTKTPCGTASYTAPEIIKDEAYSKSVDMWGVGCVLYTLLCGFPPFYDSNPEELTKKVARGEYCFLSPWWDEISQEAKDLVSHLLTVDPRKRYGPDQVLKHPWITGEKELSIPAVDAPKPFTTKGLKFEEVIPKMASSLQNNGPLSPRAEAMKRALDTGISIQRIGTPLRRLVDDYFNEEDEQGISSNSSSDDDEEDEEDDDEGDEDDSDEEVGSYTYQNKYSMSPYHCKRKNEKSSNMRFKEFDTFNLRFDDNTMLNRRKLNNDKKLRA